MALAKTQGGTHTRRWWHEQKRKRHEERDVRAFQTPGGFNPGGGSGVDSPDPSEIGARDPFQSEIESGFTEKQLHFADTDHAIKIPERARAFFGLARRPIDPSNEQLSEKDARLLAKRVLGWRLEVPEGLPPDCSSNFRLSREWTCPDIDSAQQLRERLMTAVTDAQYENEAEVLVFDGQNVRGEVGLAKERTVTKNDFILAARLDSVEQSDLVVAPAKKKLPFL